MEIQHNEKSKELELTKKTGCFRMDNEKRIHFNG